MDVVVKRADKKGKGVFALRDFNKGETILRYKKSKVFRDSEAPKVWKGKFRYLDRVGKSSYMVMQPPERFINHSCSPNVYIKNWKIIAMKSIKKGEELVFDYSINNDFPVTFRCKCGSKSCRGLYSQSFFKLPKALQKKYLPYLDTWFRRLYRKEIGKLRQN